MNKVVTVKKLRGSNYLIEVETKNGKIPHVVNENTIVKHHLLEGKTFDDKDYKKIVKDNEYELLYQKAIHFISYQMRTISEVKKHLRKDTKDDKIINQIISELKSHNYLNDLNYVSEFVQEKIEFDLIGPKAIKDKLISKGIHFDIINDALLQYTEEKQFDKVYELIQKEIRYPQKKNYQKTYLSLKQKCVTKGFSLNVVESSLLSLKDDIKASIDEDSLLKQDVQKELKGKKLKTYEEKQKVIQKLVRKGYPYELVKKYVK